MGAAWERHDMCESVFTVLSWYLLGRIRENSENIVNLISVPTKFPEQFTNVIVTVICSLLNLPTLLLDLVLLKISGREILL